MIGTFAFLFYGDNVSRKNVIEIGAEKIDNSFLKLVVGRGKGLRILIE